MGPFFDFSQIVNPNITSDIYTPGINPTAPAPMGKVGGLDLDSFFDFIDTAGPGGWDPAIDALAAQAPPPSADKWKNMASSAGKDILKQQAEDAQKAAQPPRAQTAGTKLNPQINTGLKQGEPNRKLIRLAELIGR